MKKLLLCAILISFWTIDHVMAPRINPINPEYDSNIQAKPAVKELKKKINEKKKQLMKLNEEEAGHENYQKKYEKITGELNTLQDQLKDLYAKLAPEYEEEEQAKLHEEH